MIAPIPTKAPTLHYAHIRLAQLEHAVALTHVGRLATLLHEIVDAIGMSVMAPATALREVDPARPPGTSAVVLLHESHAALHWWEDAGVLDVSVVSCREFSEASLLAVVRRHAGGYVVTARRWGSIE